MFCWKYYFSYFQEKANAQSPSLITLPGSLNLTNKSGGYYDFTYSESGWSFSGSLFIPPGSSSYPGVVVSHGKNGAGIGFCAIATEWLPNYAKACPNYTHASSNFGGNDDASSWAGSAENVKRATKALDILVSQQLRNQLSVSVDPTRLFMWGNSMGAMVTVATAAQVGSRIKAAAYTAGGLSVSTYEPNDPAIAAGIEAPFLMLHALNDGTVDPQASRNLRDALISYDKTYQLVWFKSGGHNMMHDPTYKPVIGEFLRAWFENPRPNVVSISPNSGQVGTGVIISGSNFGTNIGNVNSVSFYKNVSASISSWKDSSITTSVPSGALTGPVRLVIPQGPLTNSLIQSPVEGGMRSDGVTFTIGNQPPPLSPTPTLPPGTKPGDSNGDNKVDGLDYVIWLNNYNQQATGAANGDFDNNAKVDGLDYVIWLNNYLA